MRSHCAVYVDAGYLIAAAATKVTGTSLRSSVNVDHEALIKHLAEHAEQRSGLPLLRVHWYDAARDGSIDAAHERIAMLSRVKVRLGRTGYEGEQKGVDLRIGLDMVGHARNGAVEVMYLVSGDDDLTEAVEEAQAQGVQVVVLGVPTSSGTPHGVSRHLQQASDGLELIQSSAIDEAVKPSGAAIVAAIAKAPVAAPRQPAPSPADVAARTSRQPVSRTPVPAASGSAGLVYSSTTSGAAAVSPEYGHSPDDLDALIDAIADRVAAASLASSDLVARNELLDGRPSIPRDVDRSLLLDASDALGIYDLSDAIRVRLRSQFWKAIDQRSKEVASGSGAV